MGLKFPNKGYYYNKLPNEEFKISGSGIKLSRTESRMYQTGKLLSPFCLNFLICKIGIISVLNLVGLR